MSPQDDYILERLQKRHKKNKIKSIAVSVYKNGNENDYVISTQEKIKQKISKEIDVKFYDSSSQGCWVNSL